MFFLANASFTRGSFFAYEWIALLSFFQYHDF